VNLTKQERDALAKIAAYGEIDDTPMKVELLHKGLIRLRLGRTVLTDFAKEVMIGKPDRILWGHFQNWSHPVTQAWTRMECAAFLHGDKIAAIGDTVGTLRLVGMAPNEWIVIPDDEMISLEWISDKADAMPDTYEQYGQRFKDETELLKQKRPPTPEVIEALNDYIDRGISPRIGYILRDAGLMDSQNQLTDEARSIHAALIAADGLGLRWLIGEIEVGLRPDAARAQKALHVLVGWLEQMQSRLADDTRNE